MSEERADAYAAARIALEDAYRELRFGEEYVGQMLAYAQVWATLAGVEQQRIANLVAWKQLRQSAPATALAAGGDRITVEIEAALGITDTETDA